MKNKKIFIPAHTVFFSLLFGIFGSAAASAAPETSWDISLGSIAEAYSDYFMVGNILEPNQISDSDTTAMFKYCYNAITAENAMKPVYLTSAKGVYNFSNADKLVNWAEENNIPVHGHTLVWHSQSARWLTMNDDGSVLTREEAKANLEEYINEVAGHYAGKVISWDVVNEAVATSVSSVPLNWKSLLRRDESGAEGSTWFQAYENGADKEKGESGADYIYDSFVFARLADPNAVLYYNDYNETSQGKREVIAMMVEELNAQWKDDSRNTEPDRLLIEGIGMQAHYWTSDLNVSDVEKTIVRFIRTGAEISVSELDIPHGAWNTYKERTEEPTQEEELLQADFYSQLFEIYKKYSDNIARVTLWGKADPQSWRREGYPSLYNKSLAPKEAYRYLMETAKLPVEEVNPVPAETVNTAGEAEVTDEPAVENEADNVSENEETTENNNLLTILLIAAAVLVVAVVIVVIMLKRRKA